MKKMFSSSVRLWVSILIRTKLLSRGQTLGAKTSKKYCHVGIFDTVGLSTLGPCVKAERTTKAAFEALHQSNRE